MTDDLNRSGTRIEHFSSLDPDDLAAQINDRLALGHRYVLMPPMRTGDGKWHAWVSFNYQPGPDAS
jgi:hypothetical protein